MLQEYLDYLQEKELSRAELLKKHKAEDDSRRAANRAGLKGVGKTAVNYWKKKINNEGFFKKDPEDILGDKLGDCVIGCDSIKTAFKRFECQQDCRVTWEKARRKLRKKLNKK